MSEDRAGGTGGGWGGGGSSGVGVSSSRHDDDNNIIYIYVCISIFIIFSRVGQCRSRRVVYSSESGGRETGWKKKLDRFPDGYIECQLPTVGLDHIRLGSTMLFCVCVCVCVW